MAESASTPSTPGQQQGDAANLDRVKTLLAAKDDTQRFVGLAVLKSVLDNSPHLRDNPNAVQDLWAHISPKFLDRLLRTGSAPAAKDAKDMLDLAVSILHTFVILLPASSVDDDKFAGRIPLLVSAILHRYELAGLESTLPSLVSLAHVEAAHRKRRCSSCNS